MGFFDQPLDLPGDVHPCLQSEVHAIGSIDELMKLFHIGSRVTLQKCHLRSEVMSALDLTGELTDSYLEIYRDYFKSIEKEKN